MAELVSRMFFRFKEIVYPFHKRPMLMFSKLMEGLKISVKSSPPSMYSNSFCIRARGPAKAAVPIISSGSTTNYPYFISLILKLKILPIL